MYEDSLIIPELIPWLMLLVASSGIFVWRFLGVVLSSKVEKDSFFAKWINAIAFAMTTALMTRIIIFPTGALAETQLIERIIPFLIGVVIFLLFSKKPIVGLAAGVCLLYTSPSPRDTERSRMPSSA